MTRLMMLFCVLLLALPSSALAAGRKPLHVLILQSEDAVSQAQALTAALKRAVAQSADYTLADGEFSLEVMTLVLGCSDPPDADCLTQIAAKIKSHQFVWGSMERDGGKVMVQLRLWQRGARGSQVSARYAAKQDQEKLLQVASALLAKLSGKSVSGSTAEDDGEDSARDAAEDPSGELVIYAGDVDGQIVINGRAYGKIRNGYARLEVPAGEHEVLIRAPGYYEAIAEITVTPRRRAELTLRPERRNRPRRGADGAEGQSNSGAGWAAISVGTLLVGGGVYSTVKMKTINEEPALESYRAQFPKSQNACTEADRGTERPGAAPPGEVAELCREARTYQALQILFFGLGGVAIGTGALILATDGGSPSKSPEKDEARRNEVKAEPRVAVGKSGAEVGLRLSF